MSELLKIHLMLACLLGFSAYSAAQQATPAARMTAAETRANPTNTRHLLIEAEDLGMSHSIDKASFEALEKGWVTTAGILVPGPWFPEVLRWSRSYPNADLGIRLDLNSDWSSYRWRPVSGLQRGSGLTDPGGYLPSTERYVAQHATPAEVEGEARAQIDMAKRAGIPITHLDNHMRTMLATPALFQSYWKMGQEYGLPVVVPNQLVKLKGGATQKPSNYSFGGIEVDLASLPVDRGAHGQVVPVARASDDPGLLHEEGLAEQFGGRGNLMRRKGCGRQ
jgi:predicted glycoside hydrolase/deacetylase ChbG (UPF0249 family)